MTPPYVITESTRGAHVNRFQRKTHYVVPVMVVSTLEFNVLSIAKLYTGSVDKCRKVK